MKYEELIDNFLFGRMTPEEEISFFDQCNTLLHLNGRFTSAKRGAYFL